MADVTIYQLPDLTPSNASVIPVSDGTVTGRAAVSQIISLASGAPYGLVVIWSGSIVTIPQGWYLCNGSNSTPDLRDKFVIGAGGSYGINATGGSSDAIVVSHTHAATSSVSDPGHTHSYTGTSGTANTGGSSCCGATYPNTNTGSSGTGISVSTSVDAAGSSGTNANLPPYYALCYIMKG